MSHHRYNSRGTRTLIPARATRAPMGKLSCPYSDRDVVGGPHQSLCLHRRFRSFGPNPEAGRRSDQSGDPGRWSDLLTTDCCSPPRNERRHARRRILAVILAFLLAAVLAQAGW
jgi:hypothetical protein